MMFHLSTMPNVPVFLAYVFGLLLFVMAILASGGTYLSHSYAALTSRASGTAP